MNVESYFSKYKSVIPDWEGFVAACERPLPYSFWVNQNRVAPEAVFESMTAGGLNLTPLPWLDGGFKLGPDTTGVGHLPEYLAGFIHIQEEVSMLPVHFLDTESNQRVLDLCAAPGNKSLQAAASMGNLGTVVANDLNSWRIKSIVSNANRLGLINISTTNHDGCHYPKPERLWDRVLADVPCSCEGTVRKHPELVKKYIKAGKWHNGAQIGILRRAVELCRPGGKVIYSTCTFRVEENEQVVNTVLADGKVRLVKPQIDNFSWSPGLTQWGDQRFDSSMESAMRVWPHQNDSGGFFVAILEVK